MALRGTWVVEIKKALALMACSKAHVFLGHACVLLRHLQDVRAGDIIMTYKHALQCCVTVQRRTADCSRAQLVGAMTRQNDIALLAA
jgi:hypothetical protein